MATIITNNSSNVAQGASGSTGATGPVGPTGPTGPTGVGVKWKGSWSSSSTYSVNDIVTRTVSDADDALKTYIATLGGTNKDPRSETTYWTIFIASGSVGPQGNTGATGGDGSAGASPDHEWGANTNAYKIRFKTSSDTWGSWSSDLRGAGGAVGPAGPIGPAGGDSVYYTYDHQEGVPAAPPSGCISFFDDKFNENNSIWIHDSGSLNFDHVNWLGSINSSANTVKGNLKVFKENDATKFVNYHISGSIQDSGVYSTVPVKFIDSSVSSNSISSVFSDEDSLILSFTRAGQIGEQGIKGDQGGGGPQGLRGPHPEAQWGDNSSANESKVRFATGDLNGALQYGSWSSSLQGGIGPKGDIGPRPESEWGSDSNAYKLRFKDSDSTWGDWGDSLRGSQGEKGEGDKYKTASSSVHSISAGEKTFTVDADLSYSINQTTIVSDAGNASNVMEGKVLSYSGTSLKIDIISVTGSGSSIGSWVINLSGAAGPAGSQGSDGQQGAVGPAGPVGPVGGVVHHFSVASKTTNHPYWNQGTVSAFVVCGDPACSTSKEGGQLHFVRGFTYYIHQYASNNTNTPVNIYTTDEGNDSSKLYTNGITITGTAGNDRVLTFKVPENAPNILYYGSDNSSYMGGVISVSNVGPTGPKGDKGDQSVTPGPLPLHQFGQAGSTNEGRVRFQETATTWGDWSKSLTGPKGEAGQSITGPSGDKGDKGAVWRGEWGNSVSDYKVDDIVSHTSGHTYICIQAGVGKSPETESSYWTKFASRGLIGAQGPIGVRNIGEWGTGDNQYKLRFQDENGSYPSWDSVGNLRGVEGPASTVAGPTGAFGGDSHLFGWDTSTDMTVAIGANKLKVNNSSLASVTKLSINEINSDNVNCKDWIETLDDVKNARIKLFKSTDRTQFAIYKVTGDTDSTNSAYHILTLTHVDHNGSFTSADNIIISFAPAGEGTKGDKGESGEVQPTEELAIQVNSSDKFTFDGTENPVLTLTKGFVYKFDQSHGSNALHPLRFSVDQDGENKAGGVMYTKGYQFKNTPGQTDGHVLFAVPSDAPEKLYYYCPNHEAKGGSGYFNVVAGGKGEKGDKGNQGESGKTPRFNSASSSFVSIDRGHIVQNTGVTLDSSVKKIGASSAKFNGSSWLQSPSSKDFDFDLGDFTIEMWVNATDQGADTFAQMLELHDSSTDRMSLFIERRSEKNNYKLSTQPNGTTEVSISSNAAPNYGNWQHLAVTRENGVLRMFVDGALQSETANQHKLLKFNSDLRIGNGLSGEAGWFKGNLDAYRISKRAMYRGNGFSAPTTKLLAEDKVGLLLHFEKFLDASRSAHNVTQTGNVKVVGGRHGAGAAYFNGSDSRLTVNNLGNNESGDWMVEGWIYPEADDQQGPKNYERIIFETDSGWAQSGLISIMINDGNLKYFTSFGWKISDAPVKINEWSHFALAHSDGVTQFYVNGKKAGSAYSETNVKDFGNLIYVGSSHIPTNGGHFKGYIDELHVTKNVNYKNDVNWPSSFTTLHTSPVADENSKLLLHFDENYDDVSPLSGTVTNYNSNIVNGKFGTSAYFDGSSYLRFEQTDGIDRVSMANFRTLECWFKAGDFESQKTIVSKVGDDLDWSSTGIEYALYINDNSLYLQYGIGGNNYVSLSKDLGDAQLNSWHHVAITRSEQGVSSLWVDGVLAESSSTPPVQVTDSKFYLGGQSSPFLGYMDEVKISSRVKEIKTGGPDDAFAVEEDTSLLFRAENLYEGFRDLSNSGTLIQLLVDKDLSLLKGQDVIIIKDVNNRIFGKVKDYNPNYGKLEVNVASTEGSGKYSNWSVNLSGMVGSAGKVGPVGPAGPLGGAGPQGGQGVSGPTGAMGSGVITRKVTVSSSAFLVDGFSSVSHIHLIRGMTYHFDQSDSSNAGSTFIISDSSSGGGSFLTGVSDSGTAGTDRVLKYEVPFDAPTTLYAFRSEAFDYPVFKISVSNIGATGAAGSKGSVGDSGAVGEKGTTGAAGAAGARGVGVVGPQGENGATGPGGEGGTVPCSSSSLLSLGTNKEEVYNFFNDQVYLKSATEISKSQIDDFSSFVTEQTTVSSFKLDARENNMTASDFIIAEIYKNGISTNVSKIVRKSDGTGLISLDNVVASTRSHFPISISTVTYSSSHYQYGTQAAYLDGANSVFIQDSIHHFDFGSKDFTVEGNFRFASAGLSESKTQTLFSNYDWGVKYIPGSTDSSIIHEYSRSPGGLENSTLIRHTIENSGNVTFEIKASYDSEAENITVPIKIYKNGTLAFEKDVSVTSIDASNSPLLMVSAAQIYGVSGDEITCTAGSYNKYFTFDTKVTETKLNSRMQVTQYDGSSHVIKERDWTPSSQSWYHIALVRFGTKFTLYVNGSALMDEAIEAVSTYGGVTNGNLHIGGSPNSSGSVISNYLKGYVDEVRVTKDLARYTGPFAAAQPTNAFSTDAYTRLLLHFDGNIVDSSASLSVTDVPMEAGDRLAIVFKSGNVGVVPNLKLRFGAAMSVMGNQGAVGPIGDAGIEGPEGPVGPAGEVDKKEIIKYAIIFG